ncbi:MAG: recombination-associated protein RdgC [Desulfobulbaceae bacterium]|nr:MAG: recombination-associated protein RdgC [Desulfobulbaceae bacterium]
MALLKGSASCVRFRVDGELPSSPLEFIAQKVSSYSFRDIDESFDEFSIGWVSIVNMFDSTFSYSSHLCGDFVILTLRIDERKVSSAVLKKMTQKEEERIKKEKQIPRIGRAMKVEIRERIKAELMRKSVPIPAVYDLCWNLSDSTLLFFSTNKKAQAVLEDYFKECFGLRLQQQIPYNTAEQLLSGSELSEQLARITPTLFI